MGCPGLGSDASRFAIGALSAVLSVGTGLPSLALFIMDSVVVMIAKTGGKRRGEDLEEGGVLALGQQQTWEDVEAPAASCIAIVENYQRAVQPAQGLYCLRNT